jgi:predicted transcriptional regulator
VEYYTDIILTYRYAQSDGKSFAEYSDKLIIEIIDDERKHVELVDECMENVSRNSLILIQHLLRHSNLTHSATRRYLKKITLLEQDTAEIKNEPKNQFISTKIPSDLQRFLRIMSTFLR